MKYYLGGYNKKNIIIIELGKLFLIDSKNSLKRIDKFTSEFYSEEELLLYLAKKELLNAATIKNLNVFYTYRRENKKIPVVYKEQQKYLDSEYLYHTICSLSRDTKFLEKLARYCDTGSSKFNPQRINATAIFGYLNDVRSNGGYCFESSALSEALQDIVHRAEYRLNSKTGELTEDYRGLRDLGLFVCRYVTKLELEKEKEKLIKNNIEESKEQYSQITLDEPLDYIQFNGIDDEMNKYNFQPVRYKNIADEDEYPGDLEKWNTDGYLDEEEDNYHK